MNSHTEAYYEATFRTATLICRFALRITEDAVTAAQKEAHDKVVARVAQAQAAAEQAVQKVNQNIKSAGDTASSKWNGLKAKIAADMDDLKSKVVQRKHDLDVKSALKSFQVLGRIRFFGHRLCQRIYRAG